MARTPSNNYEAARQRRISRRQNLRDSAGVNEEALRRDISNLQRGMMSQSAKLAGEAAGSELAQTTIESENMLAATGAPAGAAESVRGAISAAGAEELSRRQLADMEKTSAAADIAGQRLASERFASASRREAEKARKASDFGSALAVLGSAAGALSAIPGIGQAAAIPLAIGSIAAGAGGTAASAIGKAESERKASEIQRQASSFEQPDTVKAYRDLLSSAASFSPLGGGMGQSQRRPQRVAYAVSPYLDDMTFTG